MLARQGHAAVALAGALWVAGGQDLVGRLEASCDSQYLPFDAWTLELAPAAAPPVAAAPLEGGAAAVAPAEGEPDGVRKLSSV